MKLESRESWNGIENADNGMELSLGIRVCDPAPVSGENTVGGLETSLTAMSLDEDAPEITEP